MALFEERNVKLNFKRSTKSYDENISWVRKFPRKCKKELCGLFLGKECVFTCVYWSLEEGTARDKDQELRK